MAKGSTFEREVCTKLSLWWTDGERDDVFTRTSGSGGRATARRKRGKETAYQGGDITFSDPIGEPLIRVFNIEAKSGYAMLRKASKGKKIRTNWCVLDILDGSKKKHPEIFAGMWKQTVEDAEASDREPLLIFRRPHKRICIAMPAPFYVRLANTFGYSKFNRINMFMPEPITIMRMDDFFRWAHDIKIVTAYERRS